jgi:hypothetical protein
MPNDEIAPRSHDWGYAHARPIPRGVGYKGNTAPALRKVIETHDGGGEGSYGIRGRTYTISDRPLG